MQGIVKAEVGGSFRPILSAQALAQLRAAAIRWKEEGEPPFIPAPKEQISEE